MITLVIATRNAHKVREIRAVLSEAFAYRTLNDLPAAPVAVEDADSFAGNAVKKSVELARWLAGAPEALVGIVPGSRIYCLADDSGLEVDALHGAPGVHSARFAALNSGAPGNSTDQANNAKLLEALAGVAPDHRSARFRCVIALTPVPGRAPSASSACNLDSQRHTIRFEGACEGRIQERPRGHRGFGYDPLFIPEGFDQSFAELGDEQKNRISHRAKALEKLKDWLANSSPTQSIP